LAYDVVDEEGDSILFVFYDLEDEKIYAHSSCPGALQRLADNLDLTVVEFGIEAMPTGRSSRECTLVSLYKSDVFLPSDLYVDQSDEYSVQAGQYIIYQVPKEIVLWVPFDYDDIVYVCTMLYDWFYMFCVYCIFLIPYLFVFVLLMSGNRDSPDSKKRKSLNTLMPRKRPKKSKTVSKNLHFPIDISGFVDLRSLNLKRISKLPAIRFKKVFGKKYERLISSLHPRDVNFGPSVVRSIHEKVSECIARGHTVNHMDKIITKLISAYEFLGRQNRDRTGAKLLLNSFSNDLRFATYPTQFTEFSLEYLAQANAHAIMHEAGLEIVAHEVGYGTTLRPDLVYTDGSALYFVEAKHKSITATINQARRILDEVGDLFDETIYVFAYVDSTEDMVLCGTSLHGYIDPPIKFEDAILFLDDNSGTDDTFSCVSSDSDTQNCGSMLNETVDQPEDFVPQAGKYSYSDEFPTSKQNDGFSHLFAAGVAIATSTAGYLMSNYSVDDVSKLFRREVVAVTHADSVVDSDYSIEYNTTDGSVSVTNPEKECPEGLGFKTIPKVHTPVSKKTNSVLRSRFQLVEVDKDGNVVHVHLEYLTKELFGKMCHLLKPASLQAKKDLGIDLPVVTTFNEFLSLSQDDQYELIQSLYIYASTRKTASFRVLTRLLTAVHPTSSYSALNDFDEAATIDRIKEMEMPVKLDRYRKTHKSDEYYHKHG
jgi:hypothetical protein